MEQQTPTDRKPVAFHAYLTESGGGALPIFRLLPERCENCPPFKNPATGLIERAQLGVTHDSPDGRAETVQCLRCDYSLTRPRRDPPGRRMNQRAE